ncbi:MAG: TonB-dependent receptor [Bacteroidota bacterium]
MKRLLFLMLLIPVTLFAQNRFTISGVITGENGEAIAFANVVLNKNNKYAVADENGRYRIQNVRRGTYEVTVSSLGFETIRQTFELAGDLTLDFSLVENVQSLDDVTVEGKKASTQQEEKAITIGSFELAEVVAQTNILSDAVDKIAGVRIRRSGSFGDQANVSINGLDGTAVRTFVDGVPIEFLFPGTDVATIPLTGLRRVDVYKGVLPVDLASDALGGGINIITEENTVNRVRATYSVGSFNTHLGDVNVTLTDGEGSFVKVAGGTNYSDNDYTFEAPLLVRRPNSNQLVDAGTGNVKRFHDMYRLQYSSATIGTYNKKWTDHAEIAFNYFDTFREFQNNLTIRNIAIGEAFREGDNVAVVAKYDKTLIKDKLKLKTISNYSDLFVKFVDTTANQYNWLGDIVQTVDASRGEFEDANPLLTETTTKSWVNRTTLLLDLPKSSRLTFSNLLAYQDRELKEFDIEDPTLFGIAPDQKITKNIAGLQYDNQVFNGKAEFSAAAKYYTYNLKGFSRLNQVPIEDSESFLGWNASLKYNISDSFTLRGSYERGFLIPDIAQFAGDGVNVDPNGELQPEESDNYNLGFRYSKRFNDDYAITWTANGFIRERRDFIFINPNLARQQNENLGDIDTEGFETELKFNFLKNFNWNTNVSFVENTIKRFSLQGSNTDDAVGTPLPNRPRFFYNTELSWRTDDLFNTGVGARIFGLFTHVDVFNFRPVTDGDTIENTTDAFVPEQNRLDFGVSLDLFEKKITAAFNVVNITDEDLFDNFSIPRPGRNFNFKLIYEISNF